MYAGSKANISAQLIDGNCKTVFILAVEKTKYRSGMTDVSLKFMSPIPMQSSLKSGIRFLHSYNSQNIAYNAKPDKGFVL